MSENTSKYWTSAMTHVSLWVLGTKAAQSGLMKVRLKEAQKWLLPITECDLL